MARTARRKRRNPPARPAPSPTPTQAVTISPDARLLGVILAVAVLLRLGLLLSTHFTNEDALITLRYAENLAHGLGFVYNPGERVLGTTTPLYTLLLALFAKAGLQAIQVGQLLNIAADGVLCAVVYRWLRAVGADRSALLAAFLVAVNPIHLRWSISGMESSLVTLAGMSAIMLWTQRRYLFAYAVLAVLFLLRWDGALLAGVLTVALIIRERRFPLAELSIYVLLIAPWLIFAKLYFGSPIPVTAMAKATVYGWHGSNPIFPKSPGLLARMFGSPLFAAGSALMLVGAWRGWLERRVGLAAPAAWMLIYGLVLALSPVMVFEWYLVPPMPVYEALAAIALVYVTDFVSAKMPERARSPVALMVGYIAAIAAAAWTYGLCRRAQQVEDHLRKPLGLFLRDACAPSDRIMLEPIGYIGYYSGRPVLDVIGLVSPEVLPFWNTQSPEPLVDIALHFRPEWCVLRPAEVEHMRLSPRWAEWEKSYAATETRSYFAGGRAGRLSFIIYRRR